MHSQVATAAIAATATWGFTTASKGRVRIN